MNMKWVKKRRLLYWHLAYKYLSHKEYHKIIGNECNIPKCCIEYFINQPEDCEVAFEANLKYGLPKIHNLDRFNGRYVMCPKCRKKVGTIKVTEEYLNRFYYHRLNSPK